MLVSVVIPAYNASNVISTALESLKNQTYKNIEILVVLDGCTDNTLEVCKTFQLKDNRIKIIEQENQGTYAARYNGIKNATGEYIMFLDSDDYLTQNSIEILTNVAKRTQSDLIRFRYERVENGETKNFQDEYFKGEKEITIQKSEFKDKVYPMFLNSYMLCSMTIDFVKKECVPNKNERKRMAWGEDLLFNLNCFDNIKNVTFLNETLYKYSPTENSITRTYNVDKLLKNLDDCQYVYLSLYDFAKKWGYDDNTLSKLRVRVVYEISTIIDKINKTGKDVSKEIKEILNTERYHSLVNNIYREKIDSSIPNYNIIINLITEI